MKPWVEHSTQFVSVGHFHILPAARTWEVPASGSFLGSQFFVSGSQSIGTSASATVIPMNIQH